MRRGSTSDIVKTMADQSKRRKIFCIGLGKTGTTTFGIVMKRLGHRHVSGPVAVMLALMELGREEDVFDLIGEFDAFDDFPYPYLYKQCAERYPDSLFVLTVRRSPERWLESLRSHNMVMGPTDAFLLAYGCYSVEGNETRLADLYTQHIEEARRFFAGTNRFLEICWEENDNARKLAAFLGVHPREVRIPVANAAADRDPLRIVRRHCDQQRFGAATRYAKAAAAPEPLLNYINTRMDARLRAVRQRLGI
jgi:hypothetical protein